MPCVKNDPCCPGLADLPYGGVLCPACVLDARTKVAENERLRKLVQCCKRDHDYDGNCDLHPNGKDSLIQYYSQRSSDAENQLCRIARFLGRDATDAPGSDRTIAGLVIATIDVLREAVRVRGGCKILSDGDACDCALCTKDKQIDHLKTIIAGARIAGSGKVAIEWGPDWHPGSAEMGYYAGTDWTGPDIEDAWLYLGRKARKE